MTTYSVCSQTIKFDPIKLFKFKKIMFILTLYGCFHVCNICKLHQVYKITRLVLLRWHNVRFIHFNVYLQRKCAYRSHHTYSTKFRALFPHLQVGYKVIKICLSSQPLQRLTNQYRSASQNLVQR